MGRARRRAGAPAHRDQDAKVHVTLAPSHACGRLEGRGGEGRKRKLLQRPTRSTTAFNCVNTASPFAQAALEFPSLVGSSDGDDVEIEPLVGIVVRQERDLAQEPSGGAVVTARLEYPQA